ncbi:MAG: glycosyltransferase family 39 protein [Gemmataceae bacterium]|nr:glycosyltransferase family 39 protein [Gemmataceae bacterium]
MDSAHSPRYRWAALTLIAAVAVLRLIYLAWCCPLDLAPDEAHYWEWSRRLDWCYYSKGPLVAWLIRASCEMFGDSMLAVRLPAVVCGSLLLIGLFTLTVQVYRSDRLGFGVVALALTLPMVAAGSSLMTIDAPFTCAWMWALVFAHHAVFGGARWAWPVAGVCIALGVLAKHTMLLWVPSFTLFLLTTPAFRIYLRTRGFWITTGIGALGGVPILAWNALNGWVTLTHTRSHAGFEEGVGVHWLGPLRYLGAQFAMLLGFWFVLWVAAIWAHRPMRETRPELGYLWWMSAPTSVFFGLFAFTNGGGGANWPLAGYLAGMVLAAGWMTRTLDSPQIWKRRWLKTSTGVVAAMGLVVIVVVHQPIYLQPVLLRIAGPATEQHPLPLRRVDPTSRLRGWRYLAEEVDRVRAEMDARGTPTLVTTERWTQASELGFYCQGHPTVHCLGVLCGDRTSQYEVWRPNPVADSASFHGQSFILVGTDVELLRAAFTTLEPIRTITYRENGQPIAQWEIAIAHGFRGTDRFDKITGKH